MEKPVEKKEEFTFMLAADELRTMEYDSAVDSPVIVLKKFANPPEVVVGQLLTLKLPNNDITQAEVVSVVQMSRDYDLGNQHKYQIRVKMFFSPVNPPQN